VRSQLQDLPCLLARLRLSQARPQQATFKQLHESIKQLMALQAAVAALAPQAAAAAAAGETDAKAGAAGAAGGPGTAFRTTARGFEEEQVWQRCTKYALQHLTQKH
jgi:hypothetical protein